MGRRTSPRQRLQDALDAIDKIERYAERSGDTDPIQASMRFDAVVRNLEIVSEATRHIPDDLKDRFPEIP